MPNIQVKDVPEDVHRILRTRAAAAGQSLQEYLLGRLIREAHRPTLEEAIHRMSQRHGGSLTHSQAVALLREDREH